LASPTKVAGHPYNSVVESDTKMELAQVICCSPLEGWKRRKTR